jgi:hypothetical protein
MKMRGGDAPSRLAGGAAWVRGVWALLVAGSVVVYFALNWAAVAVPVMALWRAGGRG